MEPISERQQFLVSMAAEFPSMPDDFALKIWKQSSRKQRAAGVELFVDAKIRHLLTPYESLLARGINKPDCRATVRNEVNSYLQKWRTPKLPPPPRIIPATPPQATFPAILAAALTVKLLTENPRISLIPIQILARLTRHPHSTRAELAASLNIPKPGGLFRAQEMLTSFGLLHSHPPRKELGNPIPLTLTEAATEWLHSCSPSWRQDIATLDTICQTLRTHSHRITPLALQILTHIHTSHGCTAGEICHSIGRDRTTNGAVRKILTSLIACHLARRDLESNYHPLTCLPPP